MSRVHRFHWLGHCHRKEYESFFFLWAHLSSQDVRHPLLVSQHYLTEVFASNFFHKSKHVKYQQIAKGKLQLSKAIWIKLHYPPHIPEKLNTIKSMCIIDSITLQLGSLLLPAVWFETTLLQQLVRCSALTFIWTSSEGKGNFLLHLQLAKEPKATTFIRISLCWFR